MYPVVFFDALRVKIRDEATVRSKAVYLALAVLPNGTRDILGIWIEQTDGLKGVSERAIAGPSRSRSAPSTRRPTRRRQPRRSTRSRAARRGAHRHARFRGQDETNRRLTAPRQNF